MLAASYILSHRLDHAHLAIPAKTRISRSITNLLPSPLRLPQGILSATHLRPILSVL